MIARPRLGVTRLKALIGALLAALAIAGGVQAAAPIPASAQRTIQSQYCKDLVDEALYWQEVGLKETADEVWEWWEKVCTSSGGPIIEV